MINPLHQALVAKLRQLQPTSDVDLLTKTAEKLIATKAVSHDGERLRIVGDQRQVHAAEQVHAVLMGTIRGEFVGSIPADRPMDRAIARLQTMGISESVFDDLSADTPMGFDDFEFPGPEAA